MKKLIARIQNDIGKLQDSVQKEGNDLLEKIKSLDLKTNLEQTKAELTKVLAAKLKKMEPTYHNFVEELRKNAKKAGIDVDKLEKGFKKKTKSLKKKTPGKAKVATNKNKSARPKAKKASTKSGAKTST